MNDIVFVHGFGVKKDSKGLFSSLAASLKNHGYRTHLIDLYDYGKMGVHVNEPSKQVSYIQQYVKKNNITNPILIGHSMGCAILSSDPELYESAQKVILLAPAIGGNTKNWRNNFITQKSALVLDDGGIRFIKKSLIPMTLPGAFWSEIETANWIEQYKQLAKKVPTTIILAEEDEVLKNRQDQCFEVGAKVMIIDGADHNFNGHHVVLEKNIHAALLNSL